MPLFEYVCRSCGKKSEFLIRSGSEQPVCSCGSKEMERVFSTFAVSDGGAGVTSEGCSDGSCGVSSSPCASGMCGL